MTKNLTIKEWDSEDRPRERLIKYGANTLSDSELIAILIRTGSQKETAIDLAKRILKFSDNSLKKLSKISISKLCQIDGIGKTKAITILSAFELANRTYYEKDTPNPQITSSSAAAEILFPLLKNLNHEECWILYLNRSNRVIQKERISSGGVSATIMDTKIILRKAIEYLASAIIVAHNHPSGNPFPGEQDITQTKKLKDAAKMVDISILDHIIISGDKYYSFVDECCH